MGYAIFIFLILFCLWASCKGRSKHTPMRSREAITFIQDPYTGEIKRTDDIIYKMRVK